MIYYIDLHNQLQKSRSKLYFGIFFIFISVAWWLIGWKNKDSTSSIQMMAASVFLLNGIVVIIESRGYSTSRIFGKAFIQVDDSGIRFKTSSIKNEIFLPWEEIKSVSDKKNHLLISHNETSTTTLYLSRLEYQKLREVKTSIFKQAEKMGILVIYN